jgi:hypothetical protein
VQRWEYKVITNIVSGTVEQGLNQLGAEGWELISAVPSIGTTGGFVPGSYASPEIAPTGVTWILRRPIAD